MTEQIQSQKDFDSKVHSSKGGMMLLFHSINPDKDLLTKYEKQAFDNCGKKYPVFTINIDVLKLASADVIKYQDGVRTICCTILKNDIAVFKGINPDEDEVSINIQC